RRTASPNRFQRWRSICIGRCTSGHWGFGSPIDRRTKRNRWRCSTSRCGSSWRRSTPSTTVPQTRIRRNPMALALDELLAALPAEVDEAAPLPPALDELFAKLTLRPVPVGSFARLWTLGTLQAKITAAYLAYYLRCGFVPGDDAARRLNDTHL